MGWGHALDAWKRRLQREMLVHAAQVLRVAHQQLVPYKRDALQVVLVLLKEFFDADIEICIRLFIKSNLFAELVTRMLERRDVHLHGINSCLHVLAVRVCL